MSSRVAPVLAVARTCIATSSSWPSAASSASVTIERSRFVQPGRDQTVPQAASVISCWNGRSKSVVAGLGAVDMGVAEHRRAGLAMPWR